MQPPTARTYFALLCEQADRRPDGVAVIDGTRKVTYGALASAARRIAGGLQARGIGRGDRVGLLLNNRLEWLELCFAANALGAVVVPFSTWSTETELDYLLTDSDVKILFALPDFARTDFIGMLSRLVPGLAKGGRVARYPKLEAVVVVGGGANEFPAYDSLLTGDEPIAVPMGDNAPRADDDALILYTSGSSARPKAVRLVNYGLVENGFNIGERAGFRPEDRILVSQPLFWSYGSANALPAALSRGATMVLQGRFDAGEALDLIERHHCTAMYTLPTMTNALVAHPAFSRDRTRSLRTGLTLGTPKDLRIAAEILGIPQICNIYGSTEVYGNCCVTPAGWTLEERVACQGSPLPGVTIRIVDPDTRQALGPGLSGEVEVKGYVTPGYAAASAVGNAAAFTADGYFRTGDLAFIDDSERLHFVGRRSEVIKKSGINVSPAELEETLQLCDGVAAAAVVGAPAPGRDEAIVAFVVPLSGRSLDQSELDAHCRKRLSRYKLPDRFVICDALPVTSTGKLLKRELKERATGMMKAAAAREQA